MSNVIAIVKSMVGQAEVISPEGVRRQLIEGDRLFKGDQLVTGPAASVNLSLTEGGDIAVKADSQWSDSSSGQDEQLTQATEASTATDAWMQSAGISLTQAQSVDFDPTSEMAATAAGPGSAGGAGGSGGGHSFVLLGETAEQLAPPVGFPTGGFGFSQQTQANAFAAQDPELQTAAQDSGVLAVDDNYTVNEDGTISLNLPGNDLAGDGGLQIQSINGITLTGGAQSIAVANGVLNIAADGSMTFTPDTNFNGTVEFSYVVQDADGDTDSATVSITVNPVDDATVVANDTATVNEDSSVIIDVLANDSDIDSAKSPVTSVTQGFNGAVSINPDGTLTYTPNADFNGSDSFTYTNAEGATATINVTVNPVNDAPVAVADNYTTDEDTPLVVDAANGLLANDTDIDSNASSLSAILVSGPANGTLTLNSDGSFTFTPDANWSGSDSFTYKTTDGVDESAPITVSLGVNPVNDAPVNTIPATVDVTEDVASPITGISVSDVDAGNSSLSVTLSVPAGSLNAVSGAGVSVSGNGTGALVLSGSAADINAFIAASQVSYTTALNANGAVTLTVTTDDLGNTGSGGAKGDTDTLTLNITPVNDAPTAVDDHLTTNEDQPLVIPLDFFSANDFDVDGDSILTHSVFNVQNGTISIGPGGLTFKPAPEFSGQASLQYTISDGKGLVSIGTAIITVVPVDDAPSTTPVTLNAIAEDSGARLITQTELLANAHDVDSSNLTATGLSIASGSGTLVDNHDGTWTYTPALNDDSSVSFTYVVTDGTTPVAGSATLDITPVNDLSVITPASTALTETNSAQTTSGVLSISDIDGPAPSFVAQTNVAGSGGFGRFSLTSSGNWTYSTSGAQNNLVAGQTYTDTLTVQGADGSTSTITVTLTGTNDAPVLSGISSSQTYTESPSSTITRTRLDSNVTLTDVDSANFDGGHVSVSLLNGVASQDQLTVINQGTGNGQISVSGTDVRYNFGSGPVSIGTLSGGTGGVPLTIALNGNANAKSVEVLIENVAYGNTSALPDTTTRQIRITVNDGDGTALGGSDSVSHTLNLTVVSSNDAPSLGALGGTRSHTEGGSAVVLDNNATLTDPELVALNNFGGSVLTLSRSGGADANDDFRGSGALTLSGGEVRLGGTLVGTYDPTTLDAGTLRITFADGVTQTQATSVLRGIAYANTSDAPPASVRIDYVLNDGNAGAQGTGGARDSATGSVLVNISAVNDAPVNATPASISVTEDVASPITGISVSDADAGNAVMTVTLSVPAGSLSAVSGAGVNVSGSGTGSLVLSGSAVDINAFIAGNQVNYTTAPNANGSVSLTITTNDGGNTGSGGAKSDTDTVTLNITAVNDAPVNTAPASIAVTEDVASPITGISVSDVDAGNSSLSVTLSVPAGSLSAVSGTGVTVSGSGTGSLLLSGSAADINAFIAANQVNYTTAPNANGSISLTITTNDGGNTGSGGAKSDTDTVTLNITAVNDAPVNTAPASIAVTEDVASPITGISVSDVDAGNSSLSVTLSVPAGSLSATSGAGVTVSGSGTGSLVLSGSATNINAFIAANQVNYTTALNANGSVSLTITTNDGGNTGSGGAKSDTDTVTLNITAVNDAPVNAAPASITVTEDVASPITGISVSDVDAGNSSLSVTLSVPAGSLSATSSAGVTVSGSGTGSLLLSGSAANINAFIAANQVSYTTAPNANGSVSLTITTNDGGNTGSGGAKSDTDTVTLNITPVNDAPAGTDAVLSTAEDTAYTLTIADFGFSDANDSPADLFSSVLLNLPSAGTLALDGTVLTASTEVSAADILAGKLTFTPAANASGSPYSSLTFQVRDSGGSANGGSDTDSSQNTLTFNVSAVADTPNLSLQGTHIAAATDFQSAPLGGSSWSANVNASSLNTGLGSNWNTGNPGGLLEIGTQNTYIGGGSSNQVIELERNTGDASNLFTDISVKAGESYSLDFDYSPRSGQVGNSGIQVFWGGTLITTLNASSVGLQHYHFDLAAPTDGTYRLEFKATDSNSTGGILDNIQLQDVRNSGLEDHWIRLSSIDASLNDTDGSETLTLRISDIPPGATLKDNNGHSFTATAGSQAADVTGWDLTSLSILPPSNFNGSLTLTVSATAQEAGNLDSATTTQPLTVTVIAVNDAPSANDDSGFSTNEDTPLNLSPIQLLGNDTDADNNILTITSVQGATNGSVAIVAGNVVFTPAANYSGPASFTYTVSDGQGGSSTATVRLDVNPLNDAPITTDQTKQTNEDQSVSGNIVASDPEGAALTYVIQSGVDNGSLLLNTTNGSYTYTPNKEFSGTDSFTIRVFDPKGGYADSVVTVTVNPLDDPTIVANDSATTNEDNPVVIDVLANDTDVDSSKSPVTAVAQGTHGSVAINPDGTLTYTPDANYNGTDSFTYTNSAGSTGIVSVTINPLNDAPITADQAKQTNEDQSVSGNIMASDPEGAALTYVILSGVDNGSLLLNTTNGSYTYTPNKDFNGTDSFTIRVYDPQGGYADSVVTVAINPVDDATVAVNDSTSVNEDNSVVINVLANDTDKDSAKSPVTTVSNGSHGTVVINPDGTLTYTPDADYSGSDSFTYTNADNNTATVTVTITPQNDAAIISGTSSAALTETNAIQSTGGTLTVTDIDSPTTFIQQTNVAGDHGYGSFSIGTDGVWTYSMNSPHNEFVTGQNYTDSITVSSADGTPQVITVTIAGTNDAAVISGTSTAALTETNAIQSTGGTLTVTDVDSPATFIQQTNVAGSNGYGSFSIGTNGAWTYSMNSAHNEFVAGQSYTDSITVSTADGTTQVITVTIAGTNDAAVITGTSSAALTETNAIQSTGGTLTVTDVDSPATFIQQTNVAGSNGYGSFSIGTNGAWTYSMNSPHNEFVGGQNYTDSITVTSADGTPQVITVTIAGTNDAPVANTDNYTTNEDSLLVVNAANGVLANDTDVDTASASLTAQLVSGPAHGSLTLNSDGSFTFNPTANWSGSDSFTYRTYDGSSYSAPISVSLGVTPVADAPALNLSGTSITPVASGLTLQTWTGLSLGTNGNGIDPATLQSTIDQAGTPASTGLTSNVVNTNVTAGIASKVSGLVYLEAGQTYTFSGSGDDSIRVVIGGTPVAQATWSTSSGVLSGSYTPATSGYYSLDIYHHNQAGPGNYDINVAINGGTVRDLSSSNLPLFTGVSDLLNQGVRLSDLQGTAGKGFYSSFGLNEGDENSSIPLSKITALLTDSDGSEVLGVSISNIPVGAQLSDGNLTFTASLGNTSTSLSGWNLNSLTIKPPLDFTGNFNLTVTATGTETNGAQAQTSVNLPVTVHADSVAAYDNFAQALIQQVTTPGSTTITTLSDFSGTNVSASDAQPWVFDNSGTTNNVVSSNPSNTQWQANGSVNVGSNRLEITDTNAAGSSTATSPTFTVASGNTSSLSFSIALDTTSSGNQFQNGDSFVWRLVRTSDGAIMDSDTITLNSSGNMVYDGTTISGDNRTFTTATVAAGTYRLALSLTDSTSSKTAEVRIDDITLSTTTASTTSTQVSSVSGNVLTDANHYIGSPDAWNAVDSVGAEGAVISAVNGSSVNASGNTSIAGLYGTLQISANGAWTYTPTANAANIGQSETFNYTLRQPDGDNDSANLVIQLSSTAYSAPTPISGNGTLLGTTGDDIILGGSGADTLTGNNGNDHMEGGAGIDTLRGNVGNDILIGDAGDDLLFGDAGNDALLGGAGNDSLQGGIGNDMLSGGNGADSFVWMAGHTGNDVIRDFNASEGDRIDLRDLLVNEQNGDITNYLRVDTATSTLQISSTGQFGSGGAADVTIKLENGGQPVDLSSYGNTSSAIVNSLIAGADPLVKVDHS